MKKSITLQLTDSTIIDQFQTDLNIIKANYCKKNIKNKKITFEVMLLQSVEDFLSEFSKTESYRFIEGSPNLLSFVKSIKDGSVIWSKSNLNNLLGIYKKFTRNVEIDKEIAKLVRMLDEKMITIQPILLPDYTLNECSLYLEQILTFPEYRPTKKDISAISWMKETYQEYPRFLKRKNQFFLEKANLRLKIGKADPRVIISSLKNNQMFGVIPNQNTAFNILYLFKPTEALKTYFNEKNAIKTLFLGPDGDSRWKEFKNSRKNAIKIYRDVSRFIPGDIIEWRNDHGKIEKGMFDYESSSLEKAFKKYKRDKELHGPRTDGDGRKYFTSWKGCLMEGEGPYVVMHKLKVSKKALKFEFFAIPKEKAKCAQRLNSDVIEDKINYFHKKKGYITKRVTTRYTDEGYGNAFYFTERDLMIYYPKSIIHSASRNYLEEDITLGETVSLIGATMSGKASEKAKKLYEKVIELSEQKNLLINQLPPFSTDHSEKELMSMEEIFAITKELYQHYTYYEYVIWEEGRRYITDDLLYHYDLQGYKSYIAAIKKQEEELDQLNVARNIIKSQIYPAVNG